MWTGRCRARGREDGAHARDQLTFAECGGTLWQTEIGRGKRIQDVGISYRLAASPHDKGIAAMLALASDPGGQ